MIGRILAPALLASWILPVAAAERAASPGGPAPTSVDDV
jgi:hypothetical protein